MVRLLTYKSYRSLLLMLYVKHSVGSKLFFQLHPRHQLHIDDDYKLNCSKLISMHYYLGNILSYKTLQHFGRVLFQGSTCSLSRKDVGRCTPQDTWCNLYVYFIVIDFYFTITRLA